MKYDFDRIIERRGTNSEKWDVSDGELPMWVADMDFATAPEIIDALKKRADHGIFGYSGIPDEWYEAYISWWKKRHQFTIDREWLVFTTGVIPGISSIIRKLTTPAEKVLVQTPVYNIFFNSIINNGRQVKESPLLLKDDHYEMDFEQLEKDLSDPQTSLMLLCNPQNPGGRIWTKDELAKVAELCARYDVRVVSDEIHCDITAPGTSYVPFASVSDTAGDISVTLISPSKAFNIAGLQISNIIITDNKLRYRFKKQLDAFGYSQANAAGIYACEAAYRYGSEWLEALKGYIQSNIEYTKNFIETTLENVRVFKTQATYLIWLDFRGTGLSDEEIDKKIIYEAGLWLDSGSIFGDSGKGFQRINAACPRSILQEALERLVKAFRGV